MRYKKFCQSGDERSDDWFSRIYYTFIACRVTILSEVIEAMLLLPF